MTQYDFKKLTIDSKTEIEHFVEQFLPYSDFNFISLLTYDTQETTEYCFYDSNLIIKFEDYDTNENFFSLFGTTNIAENVSSLIDHSFAVGLPKSLQLVPEITIEQLSASDRDQFEIEQDRDNFDYIVSAKDVSELLLEKFPKKRHLIDKFNNTYPSATSRLLDLENSTEKEAIINTFKLWQEINHKSDEDTNTELIAVRRLLDNSDQLPDLHAVGVFIGEDLIAFNTFDKVSEEYAVSSFQKANKEYEGIYAYLTMCAAKEIVKLGPTYINYEQDLGIEGLRSSKLSWHPVTYLKKYNVSLK